MSIKIIMIFGNESMYFLKFHHPIDLINLSMFSFIIKLNQYPSVYNWLIFESKIFWIYYSYD